MWESFYMWLGPIVEEYISLVFLVMLPAVLLGWPTFLFKPEDRPILADVLAFVGGLFCAVSFWSLAAYQSSIM